MELAEELERSLSELSVAERDRLSASFSRLFRFVEASSADSRVDREALLESLTATLEGLSALPSPARMQPGHPTPTEPTAPPTSLAELEKLNAARRLAQWREAMRESFSTRELEANGASRQQLEQWRKRRKLIALRPPFERGFVYPAWEFDRDAHPRALMPQLADAADEAGLDPLSLHRLMVSETATPNGSLMEALRTGKDDFVLEVVRAAGAQGS